MTNDNAARLAAIQRQLDLLKLPGPVTVSRAAALLRLPGPWTLRRLEDRGSLPAARRSLAKGDRYYTGDELARMRAVLLRQRDLAKKDGKE